MGPPPFLHESPDHVSLPGSPGFGIEFHHHFDLPVSASKASMKPPPCPLPLMMIMPLAANGIGPWKRLPGCDGRASHIGFPVRRSSATSAESCATMYTMSP